MDIHMGKITEMAEPTTAAAAGGAAAFKAMGGTVAAAGAATALAAVVVMCMTPPSTKREWASALISTVVSSIAGGGAVVHHFNLMHYMNDYFGVVAIAGIIFSCGLPGWALVRALFKYIEKHKNQSIDEIYRDVKSQL